MNLAGSGSSYLHLRVSKTWRDTALDLNILMIQWKIYGKTMKHVKHCIYTHTQQLLQVFLAVDFSATGEGVWGEFWILSMECIANLGASIRYWQDKGGVWADLAPKERPMKVARWIFPTDLENLNVDVHPRVGQGFCIAVSVYCIQ